MLTELIARYLPDFVSFVGPGHVMYWQWIGLFSLLPLAYAGARLLSTGVAKIVLRVARVTESRWDDLLVVRLTPPLRLFLTGLLAQMLLPILDLAEAPHRVAGDVARFFMVLAGFWTLLRALDLAHEIAKASSWMKTRPTTAPILQLGMRVLKVLIFALGTVTTLQQLGYPVAGLIAGLGIGGLAVALAAQKTLENLLGSIMLSVDQPFRAGDLVRLDETIGVVESIGLRSTRIRTIARTIVTVPNGKLADMRLEDISARDRQHLGLTLDIAYGTRADKIEAVLVEVRELLRRHPRLWPHDLRVSLKELSPTAIVIEVLAWFELQEGDRFNDIKEQQTLEIMRILEDKQVRFAQEVSPPVIAQPAKKPTLDFLTESEAGASPRARG